MEYTAGTVLNWALNETVVSQPRPSLVSAAPRTWTGADGPREDACEITLLTEAAGEGNIDQRQVRAKQQPLGLLHAVYRQPAMRRLSHRPLESAREMAGGKPTLPSDGGQGKAFLEIGSQQLLRTSNLRRREAAARHRRHSPHATIRARKMRFQRQQDMADEQRTDIIGCTESWEKTLAQLTDNGVHDSVGAIQGLDPRRVVLLGDLIQGASGYVKEKHIERSAEIFPGVSLQMGDTHPPRRKRLDRYLMSVGPISVQVELLPLQEEHETHPPA